MEFFMSSESDGRYENFEESLRNIRNAVSSEIDKMVQDRNYGDDVHDLSIIPLIIKFDEQMEKDGWFKERVLFSKRKKSADIRLKINYEQFVKGDDEVKRLLIIDNIIRSLDALSTKTKNFRCYELQNDILSLFKITRDVLNGI